ncbi:MAG: PspC domain-containing protein [Paraprevotella sp.]|nr:PspC domain-containing protein [Paraprevotella sp.]
MKKNITINMFGSLYAIDEDAYELLNQYQDHMRLYFSRKEGGEEITEDIERRIAELFGELKASGVEAITIEHVQDIIKRLGNPEEIDDSNDESTSESNSKNQEKEDTKKSVHKKIFRNPDDKMLGGVTSGLACFFGIDPLWLRLLMILLAWSSSGIMLLVYFILWIVIPEADSPEDRLRMQGRPVNMETLRDEIVKNANQSKQNVATPKRQMTIRDGLNMILKIITMMLKGCLYCFFGGILLFCGLVLLGILIGSFIFFLGLSGGLINWGLNDNMQFILSELCSNHPGIALYWVAIVCCIILLSITLFCGIHSILHMVGKVQPISQHKRVTLIILWVLMSIIFLASTFQGSILYTHYLQTNPKEISK